MASAMANKRVYECLNSTGFDNPFVVIEIDNTAIKLIMKIDAEVTPLIYNALQNTNDNRSFGSGVWGAPLTFEEELCLSEN